MCIKSRLILIWRKRDRVRKRESERALESICLPSAGLSVNDCRGPNWTKLKLGARSPVWVAVDQVLASSFIACLDIISGN